MKVLVVGSGGREHAIVHALAKSPKVDALFCAPGNGGIAAEAACVDIKATDVEAMVALGQRERHGLCGRGPGRSPGPRHGGRPGGGRHSRLRSP